MAEGNIGCIDNATGIQARVVGDPRHVRKHLEREPGDSVSVCGVTRLHREVWGHTPMVNGGGKSDSLIVPGKPLNKALGQAAERVEGRRLAKGNLLERDTFRTQGRAGVLEDGKRVQSEVGTVQGGSISPLLANLYLHYVFDLWVQQWRRKRAHGDVVVVRYGDDFIVGFQYRQEAERFLDELRERFGSLGLGFILGRRV